MAVLESADYEETRKRLMTDPMVQAMALGLLKVPLTKVSHGEGNEPTFNFMMSANEEYRNRGGDQSQPLHIGAVAEVLIRMLTLRDAALKAWKVSGAKGREIMDSLPPKGEPTEAEKKAFAEFQAEVHKATEAREAFAAAFGIDTDNALRIVMYLVKEESR